MQRFFQYARLNNSGNPAASATVTVYDAATLNLSSIFSDDLPTPTPKANPFTADADGFFFFYATKGRYDVQLSGGGITSPYTWADILLINRPDVAFRDQANTFVGNQAITGALTVTGAGTFGTPAVALINSSGKIAAISAVYFASLDGSVLTALNATQLTSGTIPDGRLSGTYDDNAVTISHVNNVFRGSNISLGATPAGAGAVRLTFGESVMGRNNLNTADVELIKISTDDRAHLAAAYMKDSDPLTDIIYKLGSSSKRWLEGHIRDLFAYTFLNIGGASTSAQSGGLRFPNSTAGQAKYRNNAATADLLGFYVFTDDLFHFGITVVPDVDNSLALGSSTLRWARIFLGDSAQGVTIGGSPALSGTIRLAMAGTGIKVRNNAGTADIGLIGWNTSDQIILAADGHEIKIGRATIALGGGSAPTLGTIGGSGPATAAQNSWLKFIDSAGAVRFLPVWA